MGTLTGAQMEAEIKANLGNRSDLDSRLYTFLNFAQEQIARAPVWRELEVLETGTTTADQPYISLTTRFRDIYSIRLLDGSNSRKLEYVPLRLWDRRIPRPESYTTGRPSFYTFFSDKVRLWKVPDSAYSYEIRYIKYPTAFTAASSSTSDLEGKDDIIIALATSWAFRTLGEQDDADRWGRIGGFALKQAIEAEEGVTDFTVKATYDSTIGEYWKDPWVRSMP